MEIRVAYGAKRPAERERDPQAARRPGLFHVQSYQADDHSRNAAGFDQVGERAHGARAEGSNGTEQYGVDALLLEALESFNGNGYAFHVTYPLQYENVQRQAPLDGRSVVGGAAGFGARS